MGFWTNSSGFIFGMGLLIYALYKKPDSITNDEKGLLIGLVILIPIIFILFNIAIRSKSQGQF